MASDNAQLTELAAAEFEKTNKVNLIFQQLEDWTAEDLVLAMADGDLTMSDAQFNRYVFYKTTSSPFTADRVLQIPERKKVFVVWNQDTSVFRLIVRSGAAGGTMGMYANQIMVCVSDGTAIKPCPNNSAWQDVTGGVGFAANWADVGAPWELVGFRRDAGGTTRLRGSGVNGVGAPPGLAVFTLPANWRPAATVEFPVTDSTGGLGIVRITSAGAVTVEAGTVSTRINFDGISF